ncbi:MAG TPA: hypothetical protein O0W95_03870 [Methanocorpusculum sp.]|nr:hypothetical protein [Methanocorpusculum sp.]
MERITGVWKAYKNIPFMGSGEGTITITADGFAKGCGVLHILGKDHHISADTIQVKPVGERTYLASYLGKTLTINLSPTGASFNLTINPFKLNIVSNPRFNLNIPIQFTRSKYE